MFSIVTIAVLTIMAQAGQSTASFATPEGTLKTYIDALRDGNHPLIVECFEPPAYNFWLEKPVPITRYSILKCITYGPKEVAEWNGMGIMPPAQEGDVELEVERIEYGKCQMYSYNLRLYGKMWKIISHCAWGVD